jgi:hypothetical protein
VPGFWWFHRCRDDDACEVPPMSTGSELPVPEARCGSPILRRLPRWPTDPSPSSSGRPGASLGGDATASAHAIPMPALVLSVTGAAPPVSIGGNVQVLSVQKVAVSTASRVNLAGRRVVASAPCPASFAVACPAFAPALGREVGVRFIQEVAGGTVCVRSRSLDICRVGDGLQMGWIHAQSVPAEMVDLQALRDGTNVGGVAHPVS